MSDTGTTLTRIGVQSDEVADSWYDQFDDVAYPRFFRALMVHVRSDSTVAYMYQEMFEGNRPEGWLRRHFDTLSFEECRTIIDRHLEDITSSKLPSRQDMARAYPALMSLRPYFAGSPGLPFPPSAGFFRDDMRAAFNWLMVLYFDELHRLPEH